MKEQLSILRSQIPNSRASSHASHAALQESGFTLLELLVVVGIIAIVTGLLVTIIYQLFRIPRQGSDQLAVDSDLRNAGLWLVQDGNQSVSFTPAGTCGIFVAPTSTGSSRSITYTLSGNVLSRQDSGTGKTTGVARHVSSVQCPAAVMTDTVALRLSVARGNVSASQTFTVTLRVME
jgi:prepilin-type N-terminal cleavage/methylation domain-containing protein